MQVEDAIRSGLAQLPPCSIPVKSVRLHGRNLFAMYLAELEDGRRLAVKQTQSLGMALTEGRGLAALRATGARAPEVYGSFQEGGHAFLCMQFVDGAFRGDRREDLMASLGRLYGATHDRFGWEEDNYVGSLEQRNGFFDEFTEYWWRTRLLPQLDLAVRSGRLAVGDRDQTESALVRCAGEWQLNRFRPRLIHGDLWGGNIVAGEDGFHLVDPAVSYGNPEQDLAMLELFGSPLPPGDIQTLAQRFGAGSAFPERVAFWQFYPLLVHVNLFGGSYLHSFRRALSLYA